MSVIANVIALVLDELERDRTLLDRARHAFGVGTASPNPVDDCQYNVDNKYETFTQFASRLGVSRRHVADLRARGQLVVVGAGRAVRVDVAATLDRLQRQAQPGPDVVDLDARRRARAAAERVTGKRR